MKETDQKYNSISIALHWIIGVGILLLAAIELLRHEFPKEHVLRTALKGIHQPAGTILLGLILVRLVWSVVFARRPRDADAGNPLSMVARLVHLSLYALMLALPALGLFAVLGNDRSVDFGLFQLVLPLKAQLGALVKPMRSLHETLGVAILWVAGMHAAAALFHHYVLRDGLMARMGWGKPSDAGDGDASNNDFAAHSAR